MKKLFCVIFTSNPECSIELDSALAIHVRTTSQSRAIELAVNQQSEFFPKEVIENEWETVCIEIKETEVIDDTEGEEVINIILMRTPPCDSSANRGNLLDIDKADEIQSWLLDPDEWDDDTSFMDGNGVWYFIDDLIGKRVSVQKLLSFIVTE